MRSRPRASIPPALTPVLTGRWPEQWEALLEELLAARSSSHASHAGRGRADRLGAGLSWTATAWTVLLATSASAPRALRRLWIAESTRDKPTTAADPVQP